jgi:maltooligosyltrehalose trehalohydrolase
VAVFSTRQFEPQSDAIMTHSFGPSLLAPDRTRFSIWAPAATGVTLELRDGRAYPLARDDGGWFSIQAPCGPGTRYRFRIGNDLTVPDPASRAQDGDVHGWSVVVDPQAYSWQHTNWHGRPWHECVFYELHPGLMGGFAGIEAALPDLAALGITAVELMPVADFPGERNWGYDGVLPYAPDEAYGTPHDLKRLVDAAHGHRLMIFLDVVYNHFGPDGNYLRGYAPEFFRHDIQTPWGDAIDFRRPAVRDFFIGNAVYWLTEFHFDGLRFDAVHAIRDPAFLDDMARAIRAATPLDRPVHLVLEHDENAARHLGPGLYNAQWADDLHHCLHVLLTGEREGYYEDYADAPAARLARCLAEGFAYQGEPSRHRGGATRGERSAHLPPSSFVGFLQNHDQIGNRAMGERLTTLAHPDALRAATLLLLLSPQIPLLFMGEPSASKSPFLFFTSHNTELAEAVRAGRRREFGRFAAFADPARRATIPDPNAPETYVQSNPVPGAEAAMAFTRDLLSARAKWVTPGSSGARSIGATAVGTGAVVARWLMGDGRTLTLAANLHETNVPISAIAGDIIFSVGGATASHLPGRSAIAALT